MPTCTKAVHVYLQFQNKKFSWKINSEADTALKHPSPDYDVTPIELTDQQILLRDVITNQYSWNYRTLQPSFLRFSYAK